MQTGLAWSVAVLLCLSASALGQEGQGNVKVERNLIYGKADSIELKLDLAMPSQGDGPFPAVVCIHGDGLSKDSRQQLSQTIESLAKRGYVAVTVSYRLAPAAKFPAQIEDCKAAVRWLRANAKTYRIQPDRIGALGFSSGAYLACMLGTTKPADDLEGSGGNGELSSRVQAVVSFFGRTDFTTKDWSDEAEKSVLVPYLGAAFAEKPEVYKKASPIHYAAKDNPPFLFFHGQEDKVVDISHSRRLAKRLGELGVASRLVEVEGEGHGWKGKKLLESIEQMLGFLDERLKK